METPIKVVDALPEAPVRGHRLLSALEKPFLWADRWIERGIPNEHNPLAQTGALANVSFIVALFSGVLLLFWYVPSVHQAWASLENMGFLGEFVRSLHRYSSDATMFFVVLHALRMTFAKRFAGARWIAWVTGFALVAFLWIVGWLGYWLVWDVRAETVARASARIIEIIPVFTEPLSRSFLLDEMVSTGLFFLVFFLHMLLPLGMGIALWMHISRVSRAKFLTSRLVTAWLVTVLVIVSVVFPAESAAEAKMGLQHEAFTFDWWYLFPLSLMERMPTGLFVAAGVLVCALFAMMPWWMPRKMPRKAVVDLDRCNGCAQCVQDCPYDAIVMVPRTDGHPRREIEAEVTPDKCVGCGICAGSCNPGGIGLPQLPVQVKRKQIDEWIDQMLAEQETPRLAFLCANSAGADFTTDTEGRSADLPGFRLFPVPCAGWVQALTIERALRRGAKQVLIVGCQQSDPPYREGIKWTQLRLSGEREPELRHEKVDTSGVRFVQYDRTQKQALIRFAEDLTLGQQPKPKPKPTSVSVLAGVAISTMFAVPIVALSDAPSLMPTSLEPELIVSIKHRPSIIETCRDLTPEEKQTTMKHMQTKICDRRRPAVKVQVEIDGAVHDLLFPARGLSSDGPGIGTERFAVQPGPHAITVHVGNADSKSWTHSARFQFDFVAGARRVIVFDTGKGFRADR